MLKFRQLEIEIVLISETSRDAETSYRMVTWVLKQIPGLNKLTKPHLQGRIPNKVGSGFPHLSLLAAPGCMHI